ncbi:hypothetical protein BH11MYX1_BH11MYX1_37100 [soil metagenome]
MGGSARLEFADLERAIAASDPLLGELIVRYGDQADPEPGLGELDDGTAADDESQPPAIEVPAGAISYATLRYQLGGGMRGKNATEKKHARREAFAAAESSTFAPPRLRLGKLLLALYERDDAASRAALLHVIAHGALKWGVWQGVKSIYKLAEERHDAAMFGALACRLDRQMSGTGEVSTGTFIYLKRRAWRYLRMLGRALPDAYATFCVEVLRNYPEGHRGSSVVAAHIWAHGSAMKYNRLYGSFEPPKDAELATGRAYPEAWKLSPAPLLRLLESAEHDSVCRWAISSLRLDHPLALRAVDPAWLARLGRRPLAAIHTFVVTLLRDSPEFHQSKLRALGLHDMVVGFLRSPSTEAQTYAIEYAAANAPELPVADLVDLVMQGAPAVRTFAAARLEQLTPQQLGIAVLAQLIVQPATPWATAKLAQGFAPRDMSAAIFIDTAAQGPNAYNALIKFWNDKHATIPAITFTQLLDDPRFDGSNYQLRGVVTSIYTELAKRPAREIGIAWIQKSLENAQRTADVQRWLEAGMLAGADLDVDWLKALVAKPRLRAIALKALADRRLVAASSIGLGWLLELARSSEPDLAQFAQRMLLESFEPKDFGGVDKLWEMATGKQQPEAVRAFAATYLKAHHPDLGPRLA